MTTRTPLVGRDSEREQLEGALERAREGAGSIVLLAGEAGVGKSRLAAEIADAQGTPVLRGAPTNGVPTPYAPIVAALRSYRRFAAGGLEIGTLQPHLAHLLPELGPPAPDSDRATIFEAVNSALVEIASEHGPAVLHLDDLQWSDESSLELVAALASSLGELPMLTIVSYRSDGLARDHKLRWLRNELRRGGGLEEVTLEPLDPDQTAAMLRELLPQPPSPALCRAIHDRTGGSPFFIEELVSALMTKDSFRDGSQGLELESEGVEPIPETVRDAVLIGFGELSDSARAAAEAAAVAGDTFDIALVAEQSSESGMLELLNSGRAIDCGSGQGSFRHALAREALYAEVPWLRRRSLHQSFAEAIEQEEGAPLELADHWLGAGEEKKARAALSRAAVESEAIRAYRDAANAAHEALELWPAEDDPEGRIETLELYAACTELVGELANSAKAWRELAAVRDERGEPAAFAEAQQQLASACELRGERDVGFAARGVAVEAFLAVGRPADAATERLAMSNYRRAGGYFGEAVELAESAVEHAAAAERQDLRARGLGLLGVSQAKGGDYEGGLETVRTGLALAVERNLTPVAAELYQRLSLVLYDSADYGRAEEALDTALTLCQTDEDADTEIACVTCLAYVLRERGEWSRASELCRKLIEEDRAAWVAEGLDGAIQAFQGRLGSARRLLSSSRSTAISVGHYNMFVDSTTGLAHVAAAEGASDEAADLGRSLLARWEESDDHHYAVWGVRWAASFFARNGDRDGAHACAEALSEMAADGGHADALAALAQAIGEIALLDEDADTAAEQLSRAVQLHEGLGIPFERAQVELRAGVAYSAAGERERGIVQICEAYRTARRLGAQPLAKEAAAEVAALGDSVAARLGRRSDAEIEESPLTRRELEVLRHVSVGRTNREIAQELFLSPRTVDMHVRNILRKLECRSRMEAVHRAGELELLG
ncbi:MAG TPA: AAA family ATPase [Solirubrobacterales bacterium]